MKISKVITTVFLIYAIVPALCGIAQSNIDSNTIKGMKTHERRYSLREAIKNDNVEFVKSYLDAGFDIDGHLGGKTLLSCAVSAKSMNIIKYLIDQGVDINKMDKRATEHLENPLIYAVRTGEISIVQYLVNNGADITITIPPLGYTALYYAKVEKNDEIMKYFQEKGLTTFQGEPPKSDRPITAQIVSAIAFRRHEDLENIMKKGALPDIELSKSYNPLGFAASRNDIKSMQILIKNGANVNDPKHPPLISAIMDSRNFAPSIEPIKMLVENGADVNHVQHGKRPLDYAMLYSNRETGKYLKSKGAKPATKEERRAFNEKYNEKPDMLSKLVAANKMDAIKDYLKNGGDPNEPGAIHVAVALGRNEAAKLLIDNGADVNQEHGDRSPWTPLATLARSDSPEKDKMLEMLLEAGADPEWKDKFGRSIMYLFANDAIGSRSEREEKIMADEKGHAYMKAHMHCIEILKERLGVDTIGITTSSGIKQVDIPTTYGLRTEDIPVKNNTASTTMTMPTTPTVTPVP